MNHPNRSHRSLLAALLAISLVWPAAHAAAQEQDPAVDSAVYLLRSAMTPDRQGAYNQLIRALRQLQDPQIKPLYEAMSVSDNPILKIHGILGLAECTPDRKLNLALVAEIKDSRIQQELLSSALDSELLDVTSAKQMLGWEGLEIDSKLIVAIHLLSKGEFKDVALVKKALEGDFPMRKAVAGLLLTELGDPAGPAQLKAVNDIPGAARDQVRALMLQTIFRFKMDKCAEWASSVAADASTDEKVMLLALRTAMRFGSKSAVVTWKQKFAASTDAADRIRLGLSVLNMSEWLSPDLFAPMIDSSDGLMKAMGEAGKAVASKSGVGPALVKLLTHGHPLANTWALAYAHQYADEADRQHILRAAFDAYAGADEQSKSRRLDEAVTALQLLYDKDTKVAEELIKTILNNPDDHKSLLQGTLFALVRATKGEPHKLVANIDKPFIDHRANSLKLFLLAKNDQPLNPAQLKELSLLVRGGGGVPDTIRIQAAWAYLKVTKQTQVAITKATAR
ncbi:MAG: hypothetical protein WD768_10710 [Phycisphaeraceae bacterium]